MKTILFQPYPIRYSNRFYVKTAVGIMIYVSLINLLFNDSCSEHLTLQGILHLLLFSGLIASVFLSYSIGFTIIFKKTLAKKKWQVLHQIGFVFSSIVLIILVNYVMLVIDGRANNFGITLTRAMFIGLMAAIAMTFFDYYRYFQKERNYYKKLHEDTQRNETASDVILYSKTSKEKIKLDLSELLFIKAAGNYIEVHTIHSMTLLRASMTFVEKQLQEFDFIKKCHRSYIVNLKQVQSAQGNSHKLTLFLENTQVPVSKNYYPALIKSTHFNKHQKVL